MDKWYIPITILPGVGLLLLSTSNLIIALNNEIKQLLDAQDCNAKLVSHKIGQQGILSYAMIALYLSAGAMVLAGLFDGLSDWGIHVGVSSGIIVMLCGVILIFIAILLLILYSSRAVKVRKEQYSNFINNNK